VPPDFIRCLRLDGLRCSPRATLLPPGRVRPESSRCITSRTACDFPVHQFGHGVAPCTSLLCIAPPPSSIAVSALTMVLPCRFRARPNRVRSWPATRLLLAPLSTAPSCVAAPPRTRCSIAHALPHPRAWATPRATARSGLLAFARVPRLPRSRAFRTPPLARAHALRTSAPPPAPGRAARSLARTRPTRIACSRPTHAPPARPAEPSPCAPPAARAPPSGLGPLRSPGARPLPRRAACAA
jgi:hypothetical protein